MNNAINGAMASVLDKLYDDGNGVISAEMYQSMAQLLSTLSSRCKAPTSMEATASKSVSYCKITLRPAGACRIDDLIWTTSATYSTITRVSVRTSLPRAKS